MVPSRYRYMVGVLDGLRALGGSAEIDRIYDWLLDEKIADPNDLATVQSDGGTRFRKEVRWARKELFDAGLICAPNRGIWALSATGVKTHLTPAIARKIVSRRASERRQNKHQSPFIRDVGLVDLQPSGLTQPGNSGRALGPTTGPIPSSWVSLASRATHNATSTYLMRFGERDTWKIGFAADVNARLADLNRHIPTEVLGEAWVLVASRRWRDALQAYRMEQDLLAKLSFYRSVGERLNADSATILAAWESFVPAKRNSDHT